jgi:hypothetical protein
MAKKSQDISKKPSKITDWDRLVGKVIILVQIGRKIEGVDRIPYLTLLLRFVITKSESEDRLSSSNSSVGLPGYDHSRNSFSSMHEIDTTAISMIYKKPYGQSKERRLNWLYKRSYIMNESVRRS